MQGYVAVTHHRWFEHLAQRRVWDHAPANLAGFPASSALTSTIRMDFPARRVCPLLAAPRCWRRTAVMPIVPVRALRPPRCWPWRAGMLLIMGSGYVRFHRGVVVKKAVLFALVTLTMLPAAAAAQQKDTAGCKDHPLFTRIPAYWIHHCSEKQFDAKTFPIGAGKTVSVEGRTWDIGYYPQATAKDKPSELQILRNFENAVSRLGGTVVTASKTKETLKLAKDGKESWVEVWAEFTGKYSLAIVEKGAMAQDVVGNAEVFSNDLNATGHAAVYGIYLDTGK
jgi:hypothetical protein